VIISRTPFRLSFMGGGTDLPSFYKEEEGMVLSTALDKFMYITVNKRFDESYRLSYSKTEICQNVSQIEHPIFRTVLEKYAPKDQGLEIISMADIPSGTGLGSSSSFTVGLLHAIKAHLGQFQSAEELASEASQIEIEDLKEPIGKQDQYAAAYGGFNITRFLPSGEVKVDPVITSEKTLRALEESTMVFYTGQTRSASKILTEQKENTSSKRDELRAMRDMVPKMAKMLENNESLKSFGEHLHEGWKIKKQMATGITTGAIDEHYQVAIKAGAWGGKILGAGGGGFLMFLCPPEKQARVKKELEMLRFVPTRFEKWGSRIIFVGN
jgi:D-glycero-alpha-D-manno-heptose-7-phosphate kinase